MKQFKWKKVRIPAIERPVIQRTPNIGEVLTGYIDGSNASDLEERSSRALQKWNTGFQFRTQWIPSDPPVMLSVNDSGRDQQGNVEADFLIEVMGLPVAINDDGEFSHRTAEQVEHDRIQDEKLAEIMRVYGGGYNIRVPFYWLKDQDQADSTYKQILEGRTVFS